MKQSLVIGNWKLNGNKNTIIQSITTLASKNINTSKCCVAIAPPIIYLSVASNYLKTVIKNSNIKLCSQNVDIHLSGAFTGDTSAAMLHDLDVTYVLIGHSERRIYHHENNAHIAKKISIVRKTGLIPILCIGENKEEYDSGITQTVCINQIDSIIKLIGVQETLKDTIIAYEPIWAIGSGINASPEIVQLTHAFIRNHISKYDESIAKKILIQYGGSINPENVHQFLKQKDIDGVLVGTASLKINSFYSIIQAVENRT